MRISIVHKLSLSAMFLVLLSSVMVGALFFSKTTELLVEDALEDISEEILNAGSRLQVHIEAQHEDVVFLANTPPIQGMLRALMTTGRYDRQGKSSYQQWVQRLQSIFVAMLKSKPVYLKLRFIDKNGQELIVAGRDGEHIVVVDDEQLQNKANRTYVRDTLRLPAGSVYLSDINLNREYGKISEPRQEVMRIATPVYDEKNGVLAGMLLINAEIGHELREIQNNIQDASRNIYITNDRGGYLLHPDASQTYGFDLGKRYRIQEDIPQLAKLFLPNNLDTNFILYPDDTDGQHVVNFTKIPFDPARPERFIAVGITQLHSGIVEKQVAVLNEVLLLALVLAAAVTLIAVLFAFRLARPIKQITQVMDDYAHQRDPTAIMPVNQNDEIGVLARSYEFLMCQVDNAHANLNEVNSDLEEMVHERTQELELSEIRQRSIIKHMVDGLITIDGKGIVESFNSAAEKIFGFQANEVIGNNINMLMPEPYFSEHDSYLENYHQTGEKKIIGIGREVEGQRKDGSTFPMELAVSEMMVNGQKLYTGQVRDITERKQMDRMKNEFISTVSHELRTPLTSIRGSLGLIAGGAVGEVPEQAQEMLKIAGNNTERLLLLINDILDIQKIESGQMAFKFQSLNLMPFLEQALKDNAAYGEQHGVKFVIANKLAGSHVYADKNRMMQVMANLLSNAAKFSPENETVEVSVARYHDDFIRISVTDHGAGVPEAFQPKLFDKFTQADSSDTRKKGGTGLGLSISKVIVEKHGGRIGFVSHEGVGATFYVELPELVGEIQQDNDDVFRELPKQHLPCVLIVEDDPDIAALITRMLAEGGYDSDIAYDADEARQKLRDRPGQYKIITLDLALPGEDGVSLLEDLRRKAETRDIPVVVVSVKADEAKRNLYGGAIGVVDWLSKPIDPQRLIDAVKQAAALTGLPRVLHVEDEADVHKVVSAMLSEHCELTWVTTLAASKKALEKDEFDLVLLDIGLPDGSGLDLLETIEHRVAPPRVVIFSAYDVTQQYADKVSAVLVKSKTDISSLLEVINSVMSHEVNAPEV
jgi:PAS domain S-box-containing protein